MLDYILININDYQMNIEFFINQIQGNWIRQRTIYYLNTKKIKSFKEEFIWERLDEARLLPNVLSSIYKMKNDSIDFDSVNIAIVYKDKLKNNYNVFFHDISKKRGSITFLDSEKKSSINYSYCVDKNGCLVIEHCRGNLKFNEKIFWISKNLRNTITMIKIKNKLLSISFSSAIKVNESLTNG